MATVGISQFLGRVWAVYCLLVFAIFMVPSFLILWIADRVWKEHALKKVYQVLHIWAIIYHSLTLLRVNYIKKDKLPGKGPFVIVSNHQSMLDIPICTLSLVLPFKYLAKEELTQIPMLGNIIKQLNIPVSRGSAESRRKSFERMQKSIKQGVSVLVFPEGTRNRNHRKEAVMPFYDGAFKLAVESGVPIVPVTIVNSYKKMTMKGMPALYPGSVKVYIDEAIPVDGLSNKDVKELNNRVYNQIKSNIEAHG